MTALIGAIFVASLIGSTHCAGMCGGIVALCAGMDQTTRQRMWRVPAAYNIGRLITYAALGAAAGAIGGAIDFAGAAAGVQRIAMALAGAGMIGIGIISLLRARGVTVGCVRQPAWMQAVMGKAFRAAYDKPPIARAAIIGMLTGLLPCGWLWAFVIVAAGTANAIHASALMAVFWTGTLPMMMSLGLGVQALTGPLRRHLPTVTGLALLLVGVATVLGRMNVSVAAMNAGIAINHQSTEELTGQVEAIAQTEPACCRNHDHADASN